MTRCLEAGNPEQNIFHGYSPLQGPNYALSKSFQTWCAMQEKDVSFINGPATMTASVMHNPTVKATMDALHLIEPMEAFRPETVRPVMGMLLAFDVLVGDASEVYPSDFARVTLRGSFHGGMLRVGYDYESSKVLSSQLWLTGKCLGMF